MLAVLAFGYAIIVLIVIGPTFIDEALGVTLLEYLFQLPVLEHLLLFEGAVNHAHYKKKGHGQRQYDVPIHGLFLVTLQDIGKDCVVANGAANDFTV